MRPKRSIRRSWIWKGSFCDARWQMQKLEPGPCAAIGATTTSRTSDVCELCERAADDREDVLRVRKNDRESMWLHAGCVADVARHREPRFRGAFSEIALREFCDHRTMPQRQMTWHEAMRAITKHVPNSIVTTWIDGSLQVLRKPWGAVMPTPADDVVPWPTGDTVTTMATAPPEDVPTIAASANASSASGRCAIA